MRYLPTHPRKTRGEAIHQSKRERVKDQKNKFKNNLTSCDTPTTYRKQNVERDKVEAAYLVPETKCFVETPKVKSLEARAKLWLDAGYPVHLIGPTGCGKTCLAMHVAEQIGRPVVWINGDETVTTTDLVGGYSQVETEAVRDKYVHNVFKSKDILKADWVDNPLTLACKYGYTLVYNEFSRTKAAANNVLLSVFEEGILELPTKFGEERYVKVHPNFKAILTSNPIEYAGIHRPQDALLDRMIGVYMDYYDFDLETKIVKEHTNISMTDSKRIVSIIRSLREKLPEAQKPGTRACIMIAQGLSNLNGHGDISLEQLFIDVIATKAISPKDLEEKQKLVKKCIAEFA